MVAASGLISPLWLTATSLVYVQATIKSGVADLSAYPVELAVSPGEMNPPQEADWVSGSWVGKDARVKVGPGGQIELDPGSEYHLWARVTTPQERPEIYCGPFYTYGPA